MTEHDALGGVGSALRLTQPTPAAHEKARCHPDLGARLQHDGAGRGGARAGDYPAEIVAVISSRPEAAGLAWARSQGLPGRAIDHKAYASREAFDGAIDGALARPSAELVALAGFMRIQSPGFVRKWLRPAAQHPPSLLPAVQRAASATRRPCGRGADLRVARVHFVTEEMDAGPIIAQAAVAGAEGDTAEALADANSRAEHRLYPQALSLVASGGPARGRARRMLDAAD